MAQPIESEQAATRTTRLERLRDAVQGVGREVATALISAARRVAVAANDRLTLDVPFEHLRRIQFDIERSRPATLVLVPEQPSHYPQVLAVPPASYEETAHALAFIGERLAPLD